MARKRSLGRGLDALLQGPEPALDEGGLRRVPISELRPNENQPRQDFDEEALSSLSASIRSQGLVQPIVVTPRENDGYLIVAGERRWRAARMAGLESVPVVIHEVAGDRELLELALVENLQREDLNPVEEALAYSTLTKEFGLSQAALAERVGKARPTVANALRLLNLPDDTLGLLRSGALTPGQARPLLAVGDEKEIVRLAHLAAQEGWTAREVERRVSGGADKRSQAKAPPRDVHDTAAEEALTRRLQTRVEIRRRSGARGEIRLHFHSEDELMRLYDQLIERERR